MKVGTIIGKQEFVEKEPCNKLPKDFSGQATDGCFSN